MFDPGQHVMYTRSTGVQALATIIGLSPSGDQFRHLQYVQCEGSRPVDNLHAPLLRMEPVRVCTPSPQGSDPEISPEETLRTLSTLPLVLVVEVAVDYGCASFGFLVRTPFS